MHLKKLFARLNKFSLIRIISILFNSPDSSFFLIGLDFTEVSIWGVEIYQKKFILMTSWYPTHSEIESKKLKLIKKIHHKNSSVQLSWDRKIVFVVWLTDERCFVLFSVGTTVRDPHQCESPTQYAGFEPAQKLSSGLIK